MFFALVLPRPRGGVSGSWLRYSWYHHGTRCIPGSSHVHLSRHWDGVRCPNLHVLRVPAIGHVTPSGHEGRGVGVKRDSIGGEGGSVVRGAAWHEGLGSWIKWDCTSSPRGIITLRRQGRGEALHTVGGSGRMFRTGAIGLRHARRGVLVQAL